MPITVDCGENKHDFCTGTGHTAYLVPQDNRALDEPPFNCGCTCHHKPDAKVPCRECQPLVGDETFGGVVLTDHVLGGLAEEAERGYDVSRLPRDRRTRVAQAILPFIDVAERSEATDHVPRGRAWDRAVDAADAAMGQMRSSIEDAAALAALWTICWQTGHGCELRIVGSHTNWERITVGPYTLEGNWPDLIPRLVAWAEALSHREANAPLPEPPA